MADETKTFRWDSIDSVNDHLPVLSPDQKNRLKIANAKISFRGLSPSNWAHDYAHAGIYSMIEIPSVRKSGSVIDLSFDTLYCGSVSSFGISRCGKYHMCAYCAWRRGLSLLQEFGDAYKSPYFEFTKATFSYNKNIDVMSTSKDTFLALWDKAAAWVKKLMDAELIAGAILYKEVSVSSIKHTAILPHCHILLIHHTGTQLTQLVRQATVEGEVAIHAPIPALASLDSTVHLNVSPIESEKEYRAFLKYCVKPIDYVRQYGLECISDAPAVVNEGLNLLVNRISNLMANVNKITYFGNACNRGKKSKSYIGSRHKQKS